MTTDKMLRAWVAGQHHPGYFWLPSTPDRRVPGVLQLEDGRQPSAYLWDSLEPGPQSGPVTVPVEQSFPVVFGHVSRGSVTVIETNTYHIGFGQSTEWPGDLFARAAYVSERYEPDQLVHDRIRLRMDGLGQLVPFSSANLRWDERPIYRWEVDTSQEVEARLGDVEVRIRLVAIDPGWTPGEAPPRRDILATQIHLEGTVTGGLDLSGWIDALIVPMRNLIGFALGRRLSIRRVDRLDPFRNRNGRMREALQEVPVVGTDIELDAPVATGLLTGPIVSFGDHEIIEAWGKLWRDNRKQDVITRLLHGTRPESSLKTTFTDLVEAAEGWHKAVNGTGKKALKTRLNELLAPLRSWTLPGVPSGKEIADCRNRIAHGDVVPDLGGRRYVRALRTSLRYHIAVDLGIDTTTAESRARSADSW